MTTPKHNCDTHLKWLVQNGSGSVIQQMLNLGLNPQPGG